MTTPISNYPDAPPADLPKGTEAPQSPGALRPLAAPVIDPSLRTIAGALAMKVARFFGFGDYTAEVAERIVGVYIIGDLTKPEVADETRTGADYRIFTIDLNAVVGSRVPITPTKDLVMSNVALVALTAAATFSLHVGDRDGIPFGGTGLGVGASVEMDPPEQIVLAITNPAAQAGATATLLVSTGARISA